MTDAGLFGSRRRSAGRRMAIGVAALLAASVASAAVPAASGAAVVPGESSFTSPLAVAPPAWAGFAGNAQHTAVAPASPQPLTRIRWKASVDLDPTITGGELLIHYGSPMITRANTVLVPTRVSDAQGFRVVAYDGATGANRWRISTDYVRPVYPGVFFWTPPLPAVITPDNRMAVAGSGGSLLIRGNADAAASTIRRVVFYGLREWQAHRSEYEAGVQISTPLTAGPDGSIYFGFHVSGPTPSHLTSGIARIDSSGRSSWVSATAAANDRSFGDVVLNSAPALSPDSRTVYAVVTTGDAADLVSLNASTMRPKRRIALMDPVSGFPSLLLLSSSASPTVGPDGDVFFGVLENPFPEHDDRGWLLHFDAGLTTTKLPGSFGWDSTVSVVPATAVPGYTGRSAYLLATKYNNYLGVGPFGDGVNRVALLDPNVGAPDPYAAAQVMKPIRSVLSPKQFPGAPPGARYEWCINSAVVDPVSGSVLANSEDGQLYRWDINRNRIAEVIRLNPPRPEAYTPTVIGPDGTVYAINDGTLYAIGA